MSRIATLPRDFRVRAVPKSSPRRITFVIPGEARGNSMVFALRQAESLRNVGFELHIFHLRSRTSPIELVKEWLRFRRELRQFCPDVVHAHFGTVTAVFSWLASGGLPLVITYRGSDLNPVPAPLVARLRACLGRLLSQLASLGADEIVCVSQQLKKRLWWRSAKAVVLPSGVDPDVFCPRSSDPIRAELGWTLQDRVVLFNAGNNLRVKRLDLASAALAEARKSISHLRMEIMSGTTPPERVPDLMNASDCLLLTSDSEGSPTVLQEAMACNLPVISVDVGDTAERLAGVRNSCIVRRDSVLIGKAIVEVLRTQERSNGRQMIREFCLHRIAEELARIYEQVNRKRVRTWPRSGQGKPQEQKSGVFRPAWPSDNRNCSPCRSDSPELR